ncbi:hypothetical protein JK636_17395 [Clostridium sp. YIM B02515]|uniref:Uncharacterized protein n=1 Tax=Clostridium rhizosphaerae TaxID=2803861 RepID=A0ABS1TDP4_9CLOT|nr:hypothetical protein [Clostridium rhizosphaerae]MBL4937498.1 hypothetical protein [Clostridium rhizosphaerae]
MLSKRKLLIIILGLVCIYTSTTYTFSYFVVNQKVQNSVNLSIGNIDSNFIAIDGKTPYSSAVVNAAGLIPGANQSFDFFIKNTGTLTSKVEVSFDNFTGDGIEALLPYLNYKLVIGSNSYEGPLKELYNTQKYFYLMNNSKPVLLKNGDKTSCKITIKLDKDTPYTAQNKTLKFNLNIYATQPNNPNWAK